MMHHAFIDESRRPGRYLLGAVVVPSTRLHAASRMVRGAVKKGHQRTHFTDESPARRRAILDVYTRLDVVTHIAHAKYLRGNDQPARDRCLRALLLRFAAWDVGVVMLDTRQHDRDRLDGAVFKQAITRGEAPADLHYSHRGSLDEPLLWPPDAFVWSYGAGGDWRKRLGPVLGSVIDAG